MSVISLPQPYLLFAGDCEDAIWAKTALGLRDWAPDRCVGEFSFNPKASITGLPWMRPAEAAAHGARSMVIGVAAPGGQIVDAWVAALTEALAAGLDIVSGMHTSLDAIPAIKTAAELAGRSLINVRKPPAGLPVATGAKRTGKRLLTVGTDCALGKKYTALCLTQAFKRAGVPVDFRATGQTGIMIAGAGLPIDAVVSDFVAGAAESLSPSVDEDHWDVIEGQGSLYHPSYAAVTVGLLHGSQPDVIVLCSDPGRTQIQGVPNYPIPSLEEAMDLYLRVGHLTNPEIRCAGVSLNTSKLSAPDARRLLTEESQRLGMPCADPMRGGEQFQALVQACLAY